MEDESLRHPTILPKYTILMALLGCVRNAKSNEKHFNICNYQSNSKSPVNIYQIDWLPNKTIEIRFSCECVKFTISYFSPILFDWHVCVCKLFSTSFISINHCLFVFSKQEGAKQNHVSFPEFKQNGSAKQLSHGKNSSHWILFISSFHECYINVLPVLHSV